MNKKINDILQDIEEDLNIKNIYLEKNIEVLKIKNNSTNDLYSNLGNLDLSGNNDIEINQIKNKNFDSVVKNKRLKNIDISKKETIREKISRKTKPIRIKIKKKNILNKEKIFTGNFFKKIGFISIIILIILFIDKAIVENRINAGYKKLISIKDNSGNIDYIQNVVNDARFDFILSEILYTPFLLIPNSNVKNGHHILEGGKNITKLLDESIQTYFAINDFILQKGNIAEIEFTNLIFNLKGEFSKITNLLYDSIIQYDKITDLSDNDLNKKLYYAKNKLKNAYEFADILNRDYDEFLNLLGHSDEKKYLILFQNNDEIRATGGFMGSVATITLKKGKIVDFVTDDIYAYEWEVNKMMTTKQPAPEGLNKITNSFGLRDANYYIDFGSSSRSINIFLEKINKDVDGIIYINQNTILDFLKYTDGMEFEKLGETITEDNFSLIISTLVESQSFKVGTLGSPKQILFDFTLEYFDILKKKKDYYAYFDIILKNIKSRDIVIYSFNSDENNLLWKFGLNGKINYSDTFDFAYPVYTSVGGNKSDRYIELKYKKEITNNIDCSINTNIQIFRTHFFSKFEEEKVSSLLERYPIKDKTIKDIINIQGKGENKSYVRLLLPKDAIVKDHEGIINIQKYPEATFVDFYMNTRLLETTNFNIEYYLPNPECKPYNYKIYKQPGINEYKIEINDDGIIMNNNELNSDYYYSK